MKELVISLKEQVKSNQKKSIYLIKVKMEIDGCIMFKKNGKLSKSLKGLWRSQLRWSYKYWMFKILSLNL